ncbi:S1 RNA binding domain protein [Anaerobranca californiensis DSM 14826]|jgi:S1 RNA binding domain protein|uniref:S1 RNA binding domain protein n=1 Tax=Anaerobranca californiensis DSM 14826 TaxID=1120989 RepID=A0A1M6PHN7_9FIRM|nr:S1 RNA-binding domain-containing protein [Anaerobranca californiensis]SHK07456.1 S1 RNA binding domain protein [Anaerobranca californiensis DSM 14826]
MSIEVGSILTGTVTGITNFGAFIQLQGGITGLVHISEVADNYVKDIKEHLKEGQEVKVKVLTVGKDGKIGLSIRQANAKSTPNKGFNKKQSPNISFEEKIAKFLKDSDEKHQDLKRHTDSKRGGRGSRNY